MVFNARDEISSIVTGVFKKLEEDCRASMLHDNMDILRLIIHAQKVKKIRLRKRNRESKKENSFESGSSKSRLDVQDKPNFQKRFSNQVLSNFSKKRNDRGSNTKS